MRTQWDPKKPSLGGLRYDAEGCRLGDGQYDYNKLEPTIRYQFSCGHQMKDDRYLRRKMSLGGHYSSPHNLGAKLSEESFTLEAVSVDSYPWLELIKQKHAALRAMRMGDPEPWWEYLMARECRFVDMDEDRPVLGTVAVNMGLKKNRDGLLNRVARFGVLDRQQGHLAKNEFPHWWGVIRDVDSQCNSLLVWEGKCLTDEDAADAMFRHGLRPSCVAVDSGDDTTAVYQFCLKHGFNAVKGSGEAHFAHHIRDPITRQVMTVYRIFSPEKPLYAMLNMGPTRENPAEEPLFWLYSKFGVSERLHWLRGAKGSKWDVPGDVSDDYKEHMESEELRERKLPRTNETVKEWVKVKSRNDLLYCEKIIALMIEMAGLIKG
jgi:hypothetical protein